MSDCFRSDQQLRNIIKGTVQMPVKQWQAWSIDYLFRKPVLVFDHPTGKEMIHKVQSEPSLMQLWTIPTHPATGSQGEELRTALSPSPPPPKKAMREQ